ncbi:MAG TPA: hypothetical protein VFG47_19715, partial [Geminicoccaceae bacterium]|nr:hypothetical protein [Geminicoccaceae bacterium]
LYFTVELPPPRIFKGTPLSDAPHELKITLKGDFETTSTLLGELNADRLELPMMLDCEAFYRTLAKIGHCFAVGHLGFDAMDYLLPPMILGSSTCYAHYIGSSSDELMPPHDLRLGIRQIGETLHAVVETTFFGNRRFPTYQIVCGRVLDLDLIRARMDSAAAS